MDEVVEPGRVRIGELSRRTGVSPDLLRAWEQRYGLLDPSRSAGGFRLYSREDEGRVRAMTASMAQGLSASEAAARAVAAAGEISPPDRPLVGELAATLERRLELFDGEGANAVFDRLLANVSVETLLQDVLLPFLHRLGDRWQRGEVSVAQEHFASNLVRGWLLGLARTSEGSGPTVVLACPPGEEHDLPLIMFGIVAGRRGRRVVFLGSDTPIETIRDVVATTRPAAIVLAATRPESLQIHATALAALAAETRVMIGGEGATPEDVAALGATLLEGDPVDAARSLAI
jgi:MerR family transcriptional regulator, light-induced transcriptional regulator